MQLRFPVDYEALVLLLALKVLNSQRVDLVLLDLGVYELVDLIYLLLELLELILLILRLLLIEVRVAMLAERVELLKEDVALLLNFVLEALNDLGLFPLQLLVPFQEILDTLDEVLRLVLTVAFKNVPDYLLDVSFIFDLRLTI